MSENYLNLERGNFYRRIKTVKYTIKSAVCKEREHRPDILYSMYTAVLIQRKSAFS